MCYEIPAENFLANYFENSAQNYVSLPELKKIRKTIELELNHKVYIDLTYESLAEAEAKNPSFFVWDQTLGQICREPDDNSMPNKKYSEKFNWYLPENIAAPYLTLVAQYAISPPK